MDAKKIEEIRRQLSNERASLMESINRARQAAAETKIERTEDEGDLATISHNRDVIYNLHENDFTRLRFIQQALRAMDRGSYGECVRCGEDINEKRLEAVPWATMCIQCQEQAEAESEHGSWRMAMVSPEDDGD